jgi:hypothetical protein
VNGRTVVAALGVCAALAGPSVAVAQEPIVQTVTTAQNVLPSSNGTLNQGIYSVGSVFARDRYDTGTASHDTRNSFFSFDVSSSCEAASVTLKLTRGNDALGNRFQMWEVTTPATMVNNPGGDPFDVATFVENVGKVRTDLGDGTSFGERGFSDDGPPTEVLDFPLNAAGTAAFNSARGGFFTIGGTGDSFQLEPTAPRRIFEGVTDPARLVVACARPTTLQQCRNGDWRRFGFGYQGHCTAFVRNQARLACTFEKVAHGTPAFRAKYGIGPEHERAMWSCVHTRIGF